jgi:hypothetical protein
LTLSERKNDSTILKTENKLNQLNEKKEILKVNTRDLRSNNLNFLLKCEGSADRTCTASAGARLGNCEREL